MALSTHGDHFEKYTREIFEKMIKEGDTVVDIGAHIGIFTLIAARKVGPEGHVFAFEPASINFNLLVQNVNENGYDKRVTVVKKAITNYSGKQTLYLESADSTMGYRLLKDELPKGETVKMRYEIVETTSLDEFFENYPSPINLIKMDIEGFEPQAIYGMKKILERNPKIIIFSEFHPRKLILASNNPYNYLENLSKLGFTLYEINEDRKTIILIKKQSFWLGEDIKKIYSGK